MGDGIDPVRLLYVIQDIHFMVVHRSAAMGTVGYEFAGDTVLVTG